MWKKQKPTTVECRLCDGTGRDTTGLGVNGEIAIDGDEVKYNIPCPVCVRCGGYGTIPATYEDGTAVINPYRTTGDELVQLIAELLGDKILDAIFDEFFIHATGVKA